MRSGCIYLGLTVVILGLVIYIIKNKDELLNLITSKIKNPQLLKKLVYVFIIIGCIFCIYYLFKICIVFVDYINTSNENEENFSEIDEKISEENNIYKQLMKENYENPKCDEPYIFEGFSYVEGSWDTGYVIEDINHNQYVWVPCSNKTLKDVAKLQRKNKVALPFINYLSCYNESYEDFIKSALENGGFYISRYEIGKEENKPVSKNGVEVWSNITKEEAKNIVSQMYDNINCEIINGYAYDTTLSWIENNSNFKIIGNVVEISNNEKIFTGREEKNNIYDFCDNILEYTLENLYETIVIRGYIDSNSTEYTNSIFSRENRYCMMEEDKNFGGVIPVAIRTILYK